MSTPAIPNYTRISDWLARGAQPDADGYRMLAGYGFRTIVNLREREDRLPEDLRTQLRVVHIPVRNHHVPELAQAMHWLALCADSHAHPVYFHCHEGVGRTSTFYGLLRLAQGDPIDGVLEEEIHIYEFPQSEHRQIEFLRDFAAKMARGEIAVPEIPRFTDSIRATPYR
jgi:protein tyrosine phosphatase (PTP) superfamily phosphohydrolase (DUF442 family)